MAAPPLRLVNTVYKADDDVVEVGDWAFDWAVAAAAAAAAAAARSAG